jgi:hypothetical protein
MIKLDCEYSSGLKDIDEIIYNYYRNDKYNKVMKELIKTMKLYKFNKVCVYCNLLNFWYGELNYSSLNNTNSMTSISIIKTIVKYKKLYDYYNE